MWRSCLRSCCCVGAWRASVLHSIWKILHRDMFQQRSKQLVYDNRPDSLSCAHHNIRTCMRYTASSFGFRLYGEAFAKPVGRTGQSRVPHGNTALHAECGLHLPQSI